MPQARQQLVAVPIVGQEIGVRCDQKPAGAQSCGQPAPGNPLAFFPGLNADGAPQSSINGMRCDLLGIGETGAVENFYGTQAR